MKGRKGKIAGIILSVFMLMQMIPGAAFASGLDLTWALEPTDEKKINVYGLYEVYTYGMGFCFQPSGSDKYGIMDKNGNVIIPAEYDKVNCFYADDYVQVEKDGKTGIINSKNEPVFEFGKYGYIEKVDENTFIAGKDGKFALVSTDGKPITDFIYESLDAKEGVCISAKKDGKYGVLDFKGNVILPIENDNWYTPWYGGKIFLTHRKKNYDNGCFVDSKGKILYDGFSIPNGSYVKEAVSLTFWNSVDNPDIYMDLEGNRLTEDPRCLSGYRIDRATNECYVIYKDGVGTGLADKNMNILLPAGYSDIMPILNKNGEYEIFYTRTRDEKISYVDSKGKEIDYLKPYTCVGITEDGFILVKDEYQNYGMLDRKGNIVIPTEYKNIVEMSKNLFVLETYTGKTGVAEFGNGKKVKDTFDGIILKIDSNEAKAFNQSVTIDAAPIVRNGRTMLPARFIAENLGETVSWDADTQTVTIGSGMHPLCITIGAPEAKVGPYPLKLDAPAFVENNRTYTPVRVIAEKLGANVFWDQETQTVKILRKK